MINFRLCILLLCSFVIAEEYISIELSDSKKELSQEIFKKLNNEHYIQEIDKDNFNERYFEAIIEKLDKEKNLFIEKEVQSYIKKSRDVIDGDFDIKLAYELMIEHLTELRRRLIIAFASVGLGAIIAWIFHFIPHGLDTFWIYTYKDIFKKRYKRNRIW